ncbi:hypothetical protein HYALB_00011701 [Hymenoscyphus albidus]|uniref:Uncharacterized protein n=1 Tax=Hymenoscyphus albidus TaxID=595503 RepID=A0A9N9LJ95_9HELO|nr:hypothetical protein HYALB_00011701 [Hymenoscyphus albidus]
MPFGLFKRKEHAAAAPATDSAVASSLEGSDPTAVTIQAELKNFQAEHKWDPNLPEEERVAIDQALEGGDIEKKAAVEVHLLEEDSPYPEVRAAVRNYDEDVPANTLRAWMIGMLWTTM